MRETLEKIVKGTAVTNLMVLMFDAGVMFTNLLHYEYERFTESTKKIKDLRIAVQDKKKSTNQKIINVISLTL